MNPQNRQAVIAKVLADAAKSKDFRDSLIDEMTKPLRRVMYPKNIGSKLLLYDVNAWLCTRCWDSYIDRKVPGLGECDCQTCGNKKELEKVPDAVCWVYDDEIII